MGDIEYGKCDICGAEGPIERTYFYYPVHCSCCGCKINGQNCHFEIVCHCEDCIPSVPVKIHPVCRDKYGFEAKANIDNMMPIEIKGKFIIDNPIIKK